MFKKVVSELARITLQVRGKFWSCQHTRRIGRGKVTFPSPFFSPALLAHAGCSAAKIFPNSHKWACSPAEIVNLSTAWDKSKCIVWLEVKRPKNTSNFRSVSIQALLSCCFLRQETLLHFVSLFPPPQCRVVSKISFCWLNATRRQRIKKLQFLLVLFFFYFPWKVAGKSPVATS